MMTGRHTALSALFLISAATTTVVAQEPLICRPIATTERALPELCLAATYREELAASINTGEIYTINGVRWLERVELWPELSENQIVFGSGRTTLRLNAYLRIRDVKDFLNTVRPRLNLIKASAEFSERLKALVASATESRLNLSIPLKDLLDRPFTGSGASMADEAATPELQHAPPTAALPFALKADELAPVPSETETHLENKSLSENHRTKALAPVAPESCTATRARLAESQKQVSLQLRGIADAMAELRGKADRTPAELPRTKKGQSLSALAESVEASDCDRCTEAVGFCKSSGKMGGDIPTKDNCRTVARIKTCYQIMPAPLLLPIENCLGTHPQQVWQRLQRQQQTLKQKLSTVTASLRRGPKACTNHEYPTTPF